MNPDEGRSQFPGLGSILQRGGIVRLNATQRHSAWFRLALSLAATVAVSACVSGVPAASPAWLQDDHAIMEQGSLALEDA